MKNVRELVSRRIAILGEQAANAKQAGTRTDLIEAQLVGWRSVLAMYDAGVIATTPKRLDITDIEVVQETNSMKFGDKSYETWVRRKLERAGFDTSRPMQMMRLPEGGVRYTQEAVLPNFKVDVA